MRSIEHVRRREFERSIRLRERAERCVAAARDARFQSLFRTRILSDSHAPMKYGSHVLSLDSRPLGVLDAINSCCIEVVGPEGRFTVRLDGVFVVSFQRVELICNATDIARYNCAIHANRIHRDGQ